MHRCLSHIKWSLEQVTLPDLGKRAHDTHGKLEIGYLKRMKKKPLTAQLIFLIGSVRAVGHPVTGILVAINAEQRRGAVHIAVELSGRIAADLRIVVGFGRPDRAAVAEQKHKVDQCDQHCVPKTHFDRLRLASLSGRKAGDHEETARNRNISKYFWRGRRMISIVCGQAKVRHFKMNWKMARKIEKSFLKAKKTD